MIHSPQEVLDRLVALFEELHIEKSVDAVFFREDHDDYQVVLDDNFHCEIRKKLIDVFLENDKHADTRRELLFLLKHANEYEEWEDSPVTTTKKDDIVID